MIIYNVTVNVEKSINDKWLLWIKEHINKVLATRKFVEAKLSKVLVEDDLGSSTYSIQYKASSREELDDYYKNFAQALRQESIAKFADKAVAFRTELEIIDEYFATK